MKKFSLFAFLLLSLTAFAQNKFIEVQVTDTISLRPASLRCNIYIVNEEFAYPTDSVGAVYTSEYDPMAEQEKEKNKLQEIKRKLEAKKYKVTSLKSDSNPLRARIYDADGWSVEVNSEAEVEKVKEIVKDDATVDVQVIKYADETKAEEQLIKKIFDKARARAAVIGSQSGLRPGRILEVKEGKPGGEFESYLTELMKVSRMGMNNGGYMGSLSRTFVVKFAAE